MKMNKIMALLVAATLSGCATPPPGARVVGDAAELPSIHAVYASQLEKIKIGMTVSEFKVVFPGAYIGGQAADVTAYEVVNAQQYVTKQDMDIQESLWWGGSPAAKTKNDRLWFYFRSGKLVKWGAPQDWPRL